MRARFACMQLMWGDVAGERLAPFLDEVAALGFAGVGLTHATLHAFLDDHAPLIDALARRGLALASSYAPMSTPIANLVEHCRLLRAAGCDDLVLHGWPRGGRAEYDALIAALDERSRVIAAEGVRAGFHHHDRTPIETYAETAEHLARLDASRFHLFCDTGHATQDFPEFPRQRRAVELLERHWDRLALIELKDWSPAPAFATDLGDGVAGLAEVAALTRARGYAGWLVLEQNAPSAGAAPAACARRSLERARALFAATATGAHR